MTTPTPPPPGGGWCAGPAGEPLWIPDQQPASPDGSTGWWAWAPGGEGGGSWRWYGAVPVSGPLALPDPALEPGLVSGLVSGPSSGVDRPRGPRRLPVLLVAALVAALSVTGVVAAARSDAPAPEAAAEITDDVRTERLLETANVYAGNVLSGDDAAVSAQFDPLLCNSDEQQAMLQAADRVRLAAEGARMKVRSVVVNGAEGMASDYEFSAGASPDLRQLAEGMDTYAAWPWRWRDGRWWFAGACLSDSSESPDG